MKNHINRDDKMLISFSDVLSILRRSKKMIVSCAIAIGMVGALWALIRPVRYEAEGTFREKGIKHSPLSSSSSLVQLLGQGGGLGGTESEAASLMTTRTILQDVIEKLHLQADLQADEERQSKLKLAKDNMNLALTVFKDTSEPVLKDECCQLKIQSLTYTGEIPLSLHLKLDKEGRFDLFKTSTDEWIGKGRLGIPFHYQELAFNLEPARSAPIVPQSFTLSVDSLPNTTKAVSKVLKVEPTKLDKSLLKITYMHRNRHMASAIVNAVMDSFQSYSKKYHVDMAMKQLDYLSQRRDHLSQNLTHLMHKHADFLANDIYGSGFIESNKEMDFLARSQHEYKRKLLDNELEIKRLTNIKFDDFTHYDRYSANDGDPTIINNIFSEMRSLKQQRDALEIEVQKKAISQGANLQTYFEQQLNELKEVQQYLIDLRKIEEQFRQGDLSNHDSTLFRDPRFLLKAWFERLKNARNDSPKSWQEAQESVKFYLNNLERLFAVHERILQERLTHQQNPAGEYQGISLEVATDLYRDFCKQLIQMESTIRQNTFFIHQIEDPQFEITSLSAGLNDSISSEIIHKASGLVLNLRDQNNQSLREQERIREELHLERTFLTLHLQQMVQLMELNKQLIDEKIFALQNVSLDLIHQRITLLEKNLHDYLRTRLNNLEQEKALIKRHLENIHNEMAQLPQKWVSEQLLTQEVATNHLIVEEIAKLVETKNISHNLEVIQSAPVDLALPPVHPIMPKIFILGILGGLMGGLMGACFALAKSLGKGMTVSPKSLEQMHCHVSGHLINPLSTAADQLAGSNLETLRRLQVYFDTARAKGASIDGLEHKVMLLVEGKGPHYAPFIADLLVKRGMRVLTLDIDFQSTQDGSPGLLQLLKGEVRSPPIHKGESGDWIASGGCSPFANELIRSVAFRRLLEELSTHYDWIMVVSQAEATSVETESLLPLFPLTALTLNQEKMDELHFIFQFIQEHPTHHLTFIFAESMT